MCLLLLTIRSAHAQYGGWQYVPCNASGVPLTNPVYDQNGLQMMSAINSGTASETYPAAMTQAAQNDASDFGYYLNMDRGYFPIPILTIDPVYDAGTGGYLYDGTTVSDTSIEFESYSNAVKAPNYVNRDGSGTLAMYSVHPTSNDPYVPTASGLINGSVTAHVNGQLTAYFKCTWQGPGPQPAYPTQVPFLVNTGVQASAGVSFSNGTPTDPLTAKVSASDGFGDTFGPLTADTSNPNPQPQSIGWRHLVQAPVSSSGVVTVSASGSLDGYADNEVHYGTLGSYYGYPYLQTTNGPALASASASLTGSAGHDDRAVTISASVDVTNMKAPAYNSDGSIQFDAYNNIIYQAIPHSASPDGTMYGDIGIGYGSYYIPGNPGDDDIYKVNYTPHLAGVWGAASTYYWFSSLKNSGGGGPTFGNTYIEAATGPETQTSSGTFLINPGDTGNVDHIHLTVTDSADGALATGNYYLALHQPVEFLPSKQATEYVTKEIEDVEVAAPGYASPGLTVNCKWNAPGAYWDYLGGSVGAMAEIPGVDEAFPWFGLFCAAAGIALDHLKPVADTGGTTFDPVQPGSTFPDEANHPFATTPHALFEMKPHILGLYQRTHLLRDTWNTSGFVSETPIDSDVYQREGGSFGEYDYVP